METLPLLQEEELTRQAMVLYFVVKSQQTAAEKGEIGTTFFFLLTKCRRRILP